jgi:hypothetical protein
MSENYFQSLKSRKTYVIYNYIIKTFTETYVIELHIDKSSIFLYINGWNIA